MWSFNPPGGMVTANLAAAVEGFVTSVAVGKDAITRLGTVTFERLLDQVCYLRAHACVCVSLALTRAECGHSAQVHE